MTLSTKDSHSRKVRGYTTLYMANGLMPNTPIFVTQKMKGTRVGVPASTLDRWECHDPSSRAQPVLLDRQDAHFRGQLVEQRTSPGLPPTLAVACCQLLAERGLAEVGGGDRDLVVVCQPPDLPDL